MSRLPSLHKDDLGDDALAIWERIARMQSLGVFTDDGGLAGPFNAFLYAPEIGARLAALGTALLTRTSVPRRTMELMVITVGAHWKAEFEWYAHARMARESGVADSIISAIEQGDDPPFDSEDDRVMYTLARQVVATGWIDDGTYHAAERIVGHQGLVESVSLCGFYTLISFILNGFDVPVPPGETPVWGS